MLVADRGGRHVEPPRVAHVHRAAHHLGRVRDRAPTELRQPGVVDALGARPLGRELLPAGQRDLDLLGGGGVDRGALHERAGVHVDRATHAVGPLVDDLADERAAAAVADEDDVALEGVDEVGDGADVVGARDAGAVGTGLDPGQGRRVHVELVGQGGDDVVPRPTAEPETRDEDQ